MTMKIGATLFIGLCLFWDLREGRIPNRLILLFLLPLALRAALRGLPHGFLGISLPLFGLLLLIWYFDLLGGGDVKAYLALTLFLEGELLGRLLFLSLVLSLAWFVAASLRHRRLVRSLPMMPFVAAASLVLWL